jgi:DNA-binding transcriptional regulator YdaS (Cro superfamily)
MTIDQLVQYFGSQAKAAQALGCTQPCVSNWKTRQRIPALQQIKAERISRGKLKADPSILGR